MLKYWIILGFSLQFIWATSAHAISATGRISTRILAAVAVRTQARATDSYSSDGRREWQVSIQGEDNRTLTTVVRDSNNSSQKSNMITLSAKGEADFHYHVAPGREKSTCLDIIY